MSQLVVLNLGQGNWQQGFSAVTAQLWQGESTVPMQVTGSLPGNPDLESCYRHWQKLYTALYCDRNLQHPRWRRMEQRSHEKIDHQFNHQIEFDEFEIDEDDITQVSRLEFDTCGTQLRQGLNEWLSHGSFYKVDRQLRTQLLPKDEIRLIITAEAEAVLQFPWCLWSFFEDFPKAELALSPTNYRRVTKTLPSTPRPKVRILAILGDSRGIDIERDRTLLEQLPNTEIQLLVEPTQTEISQQLWQAGWDMLFFAGHSSSQVASQPFPSQIFPSQTFPSQTFPSQALSPRSGSQGTIQINPTTTLTIEQLKYGLKQAIAQGLKLAIFNSCDGLGLARDLADLQIPQVIVMREPVPDRVAQEFLTHFLAAFSTGASLYLAVREAREKLQALETDFPGATWLPVICQNPAEVPQVWQDWHSTPASPAPSVRRSSAPQRRDWQRLALSSAIATAAVLGLRASGLLQPLELWGLDQGMRLRPSAPPDSRLLVVTITEADIQAQKSEPRKGSLSDKTLYQLLAKLEQYQAAVIGLDLYRDFAVEPTQPQLAHLMKTSDRFIAICKRPDPIHDPQGIDPPPEVDPKRVGFSDFVEDADGVLRRQLLLLSPNPISPCSTNRAFAVQLAFRYLQTQGITASFSEAGELKFGDRIIPKLRNRTGGYQAVDAAGSQLLLNYRGNPRDIAQQATVDQILNQKINPDAIKNRIILIGVTANSASDYWVTPYGRGFGDRVPGVFLQAQMVSQILSAAANQRQVMGAWPLGIEALWIYSWALINGALLFYIQGQKSKILVSVTLLGTMTGFCFIILSTDIWAPWVPTLLVCTMTQTSLFYRIEHSNPTKNRIKNAQS